MILATKEDFEQVKSIFYKHKKWFPHVRTDYMMRMIDKEQLILENDILKEGFTSDNLPKGLVLSFISNENDKKKYHYEYSEFNQSFEQLKEWSDRIILDYQGEYLEIKYHWWKINHYECTLVYRDREWWLQTMPEILNFWEDVEHYRKVGNQELLDKKDERKKKRKKKATSSGETDSKNIITINQEITTEIESNFLLDSDSDSE